MKKEIFLTLSLSLILLVTIVAIIILLIDNNRSNILSKATLQTTLNNLIESKELYLIYIIPGNESDTTIYQCGTDIVFDLGYTYGKSLTQAYVFVNNTCYYNNIKVDRILCDLEIFSKIESFYIIIDYSFDRAIDMRNRALLINPLILESCSHIIN